MFSESAPLYQRLVVEQQTLLSLRSWEFRFQRDPGLFVVSATLKPEEADFDAVLGAIQAALNRIATGEIDAERINAVRSHTRYALLASLQTPADVADLIGGIIAAGGTLESLTEYLAALDAVTEADIASAAAAYLTESRRFAVSLAPRTEADGPRPPPSAPCSPTEGSSEEQEQ